MNMLGGPHRLDLLTVRSRYLNSRFPAREIPYDRVIGIECDLGTLACNKPNKYDAKGSVNLEDATGVVSIEADTAFTTRLMTFAWSFYREGPRPGPLNCHRFAAWMSGKYLPGNWDGSRLRSELDNWRAIASDQAVEGEHLVFGTNRKRHIADHSVIALGGGACIGVMEWDGYIGVEPIDTMVESCKQLYDRPGCGLLHEMPVTPLSPGHRVPAVRLLETSEQS